MVGIRPSYLVYSVLARDPAVLQNGKQRASWGLTAGPNGRNGPSRVWNSPPTGNYVTVPIKLVPLGRLGGKLLSSALERAAITLSTGLETQSLASGGM